MATDHEVAANLIRVGRNQLSLNDFEDWFLVEAVDDDTALKRAVAEVLAESAGNVDESVAIRQLMDLVLERAGLNITLGVAATTQRLRTSGWFSPNEPPTTEGPSFTWRPDVYRVPA